MARLLVRMSHLLQLLLCVHCALSDRLIIQMRRYAPALEHRELIRKHAFDLQMHINVREETTRPTDFVVADTPKECAAEVEGRLSSIPEVRRVVSDSLVVGRAPLAVSPPNNSFASTSPSGDDIFGVTDLWQMGINGTGIRVAIFDTGIARHATDFHHEVQMSDWTDEGTTYDKIGHGTFVAELIAGTNSRCGGIAPGAELYTFRVFTKKQISYTSWFLEAFNYALFLNIDIINLSIGGPDHSDKPFLDKVNEVVAAGITIVSAIGNDGPLYGSLNNPGDMMEVVGVGGVETNGNIAPFSSRGMTLTEFDLPAPSYGRVKPDIVTIARNLRAPSMGLRRCMTLSGTSVAAPIVTGGIALALSSLPPERRRIVGNPASVKRALIQSAKRLRRSHIFEQGAGFLDIAAAVAAMRKIDEEFVDRTADIAVNFQLLPFFLDFTREGCPYMWPFCAQSFFASRQPEVVNVTLFNPDSVTSEIDEISWIPGRHGELINIDVTVPGRVWPWTGGFGVRFTIDAQARNFAGVCEGTIIVSARSIPSGRSSTRALPVRIDVDRVPKKSQRLLWDIAHNLQYPPAFIPRDNLESKETLDWLGDHPHTNFHEFFTSLIRHGYTVEVWDKPINCLTDEIARKYAFFVSIDPELPFNDAEIKRCEEMVRTEGVNLVLVAEWYNPEIISKLAFTDDNTRSTWTAVGGGSHLPSINRLLRPFNISFGDSVYDGYFSVGRLRFPYSSGTALSTFPQDGKVLVARSVRNRETGKSETVPVFGLYRKMDEGGILVFGDSGCLDTDSPGSKCHRFIIQGMQYLQNVSVSLMDRDLLDPSKSQMAESQAQELPESLQSILRPHVEKKRRLLSCSTERRFTLARKIAGKDSGNATRFSIPIVSEAKLPQSRNAVASNEAYQHFLKPRVPVKSFIILISLSSLLACVAFRKRKLADQIARRYLRGIWSGRRRT